MADMQIREPEIKNAVIIARPLAEECKKCGQGIAVTTEGFCGVCDQEVNEWPTSK